MAIKGFDKSIEGEVIVICKNCGSQIDVNGGYCPNCGVPIENIVINNNNNNNINSINTNGGINASINNNSFNRDTYVAEFIGNKYEAFKSGGYSWCTLLFGIYYTLYRKMYLFSLIWSIIIILINTFIPNYGYIIVLIINIVIGLFTKNLYVEHAQKKVNGIIEKNMNQGENKLLEICRKKGSTTILIPFLALILIEFISIILKNGGIPY